MPDYRGHDLTDAGSGQVRINGFLLPSSEAAEEYVDGIVALERAVEGAWK